MGRGITESDVHSAADALVAGGERPTVERIRAHLGTGSPNTVIRWLETWWTGLGQRLATHQAQVAIPAAPEAVAAAAGRLWVLALEQAQAHATEKVAADRAACDAARITLQQERETMGLEATATRQAAERASQAEQLATARSNELERLVAQLEARSEELTRQRDDALGRAAQLEAAWKATESRLVQLQQEARAERESLAQHIRAVEDRASVEIDRARQETKELQIRSAALSKEQESLAQSLRKVADLAAAKAIDAAQEARVERARADALEVQLGKLQSLPEALEAAWKRQEAAPKLRGAASRLAKGENTLRIRTGELASSKGSKGHAKQKSK